VHKLNDTAVKVFNITNGFLIATLPYPIQNIQLHRHSKILLVDNRTVVTFSFQKQIFEAKNNASGSGYLYGKNPSQQVFKLKKVDILATLSLPRQSTINLPGPTFVSNFWNATVENITLITSLS
jgi:hypothetical protein